MTGHGTSVDFGHLRAMPNETLQQPLEVAVVGDEIVITGPGGLSAALTLDAVKASIERLKAAVEQIDGGETYQKPLG